MAEENFYDQEFDTEKNPYTLKQLSEKITKTQNTKEFKNLMKNLNESMIKKSFFVYNKKNK